MLPQRFACETVRHHARYEVVIASVLNLLLGPADDEFFPWCLRIILHLTTVYAVIVSARVATAPSGSGSY